MADGTCETRKQVQCALDAYLLLVVEAIEDTATGKRFVAISKPIEGDRMNLNLFPFAVLWAILALAVLTLLLIRKKIAAGEDDTLHVMDGDAGMVPRQKKIAHELELIDRWGKSLTVIAIVFGLIVGGLFVYQGWLNASSYMAH